ncbi:MAG: DUF2141 domain-containing protein [Sneathiella sp.]
MNKQIRSRISNVSKSLSILLGFSLLTISSATAADLIVNVNGVRSSDGTIRIALHDGTEGFPKARKPVAVQASNAAPGALVFVFPNLQPGIYAITLFHDENGDEKLDSNLFGIPTEGYGFSNNATGTMGPPSFADAAIEVGGSDVTNTVSLQY